MSDQTCVPTNLNSELENSTETSTSHLRDDTNSEPPSIIRQQNDSEFSQNLGYNSVSLDKHYLRAFAS